MTHTLDDLFKEVDPELLQEAIERAQARDKRIASVNLDKHYRDAIDILDYGFAFFLSDVLNMGKPQWDHRIPTAAVYLPADKTALKDFKFIVNPTFAAMLKPDEFAFILAHETMHILLNHLKVLPRMRKQGAIDRKANISADCLINDYLNSQGVKLSERLKKTCCSGEDWCGYDASYATVRQVYIDLDEDKWQKDKEMQEAMDALGEYLSGLGTPATGDHEWIYSQEASQGTAEEIAKGAPPQVQDTKDKEDNKPKKFSAGAASNDEVVRRFQETNKVGLNWVKLLQMVNPDFLKLGGDDEHTSFARIPRRMTYMHEKFKHMGRLPTKEVVLPKKGEQPAIVMYLDGSGSCYDWIDKFVTLAKSVPEDKITLFPFSFSTFVKKLNIKEKQPELAGGGTEFSIIERSIREEVVPILGHYPKAVVIMSDGEGQFQNIRPEGAYADRWLWLIKGNYAYGNRCGKDVPVHEFCDGMI